MNIRGIIAAACLATVGILCVMVIAVTTATASAQPGTAVADAVTLAELGKTRATLTQTRQALARARHRAKAYKTRYHRARRALARERRTVSFTPKVNKLIARAVLDAGHGWGHGRQWTCTVKLIERESGWDERARNRHSGAYGLPQSLPARKMASAGSDYLWNPGTQIRWFAGYVLARHKTPCGAWNHSQRVGWY